MLHRARRLYELYSRKLLRAAREPGVCTLLNLQRGLGGGEPPSRPIPRVLSPTLVAPHFVYGLVLSLINCFNSVDVYVFWRDPESSSTSVLNTGITGGGRLAAGARRGVSRRRRRASSVFLRTKDGHRPGTDSLPVGSHRAPSEQPTHNHASADSVPESGRQHRQGEEREREERERERGDRRG